MTEHSKDKGKARHDEHDEDAAKAAAAVLIQRLWRGKHNTVKDQYMDASLRWDDAATNAKLAVDRNAALDGQNSPMQRWRRAVVFIGQMRDKNDMLSGEGIETDAEEKHLETQHWLEMIDGKHRYGSNLKWYHKRWEEDDTRDNFFKWLDYGAGKNLSLNECPRERLEKERILYLSAEQRLNYLVKISEDGKLLWAKNNQPVDTTSGHWKDSGDGQGVIPDNLPTRSESAKETLKKRQPFDLIAPVTSDSSSEQDNEATHYAGLPEGKSWWARLFRRNFTPKGVMERLLRKTVRKNTWMYVADKRFNIFIGIKETGAFQHSSFVAGGVVSSAGLITVKQGVIHTLSPLSGHYRTKISHFHKFIDVLSERGVDMHKVEISKAEAALWGIEHIAKFKKAQSKVVATGKKKVKHAPAEVKKLVSSKDTKGNDGHKKEIAQEQQGSEEQKKEAPEPSSKEQEESTKPVEHIQEEPKAEPPSQQKEPPEPPSRELEESTQTAEDIQEEPKAESLSQREQHDSLEKLDQKPPQHAEVKQEATPETQKDL